METLAKDDLVVMKAITTMLALYNVHVCLNVLLPQRKSIDIFILYVEVITSSDGMFCYFICSVML